MARSARRPPPGVTSLRSRRAISTAVRDICRGRAPELPDDSAVRREFRGAVRHHRVAPLAHVLLRSGDPPLAALLKPDRDAAMGRHLAATLALDDLGRVLGDIGWATFKGPILSEHAHPAPGLRSYTDVDVLISPSSLRTASARLLDAGWEVADYDDMLANPDTPGEMHWVGPHGTLLDLHWSVINMASTRREFTVRTDELLDRRVRVPVGGASTWTLDPVDTVAHVALHAALTGAHRMLLLLDVDQLARRIADWDELVDRAHSWGAGPALGIVLARARALLGTPLPKGLTHDLGITAGLRVVSGTVDRLAPVSSVRRESSLARLVARSSRSTSGRTSTAIVRRSARGLTGRMGISDRAPTPADRRPADRDALETYLRMVEVHAEAVS